MLNDALHLSALGESADGISCCTDSVALSRSQKRLLSPHRSAGRAGKLPRDEPCPERTVLAVEEASEILGVPCIAPHLPDREGAGRREVVLWDSLDWQQVSELMTCGHCGKQRTGDRILMCTQCGAGVCRGCAHPCIDEIEITLIEHTMSPESSRTDAPDLGDISFFESGPLHCPVALYCPRQNASSGFLRHRWVCEHGNIVEYWWECPLCALHVPLNLWMDDSLSLATRNLRTAHAPQCLEGWVRSFGECWTEHRVAVSMLDLALNSGLLDHLEDVVLQKRVRDDLDWLHVDRPLCCLCLHCNSVRPWDTMMWCSACGRPVCCSQQSHTFRYVVPCRFACCTAPVFTPPFDFWLGGRSWLEQ